MLAEQRRVTAMLQPLSSPAPAALWAGRVISALVVLAMIADGANLLLNPGMAHELLSETGFPDSAGPQIAVLAIVLGLIYAYPPTAVLGAMLITAFMGGAISAHLRLGEMASPPILVALLLGILAWGGLYLRDLRVRRLLPWST